MTKEIRIPINDLRWLTAATEKRLKLVVPSWSKAEDLIWELVRDSNIFNESANTLNIEGILIEHVALDQRFMLDRWLDAVRRIDKHIDELSDISLEMQDAVSEPETIQEENHDHR
jgi:hypothetical protein